MDTIRGNIVAGLQQSSAAWHEGSMRDLSQSSSREEDDEEALKWAALEKLPTYNRIRKGILKGSRGEREAVDIETLGFHERKKNGYLMNEFVPQRTSAYISQHDQIVNSLRQSNHILDGTALIALLQPAPETYELFDDIILLSEGQIVYQGPRGDVLEFFESMGFRCPERKGVADYRFVPVKEFSDAFQSFHVGRTLGEELSTPFDKSKNHPAALTTSKYGIAKKELLKACFAREYLLMKRNSFVYIFKLRRRKGRSIAPRARNMIDPSKESRDSS